MRKHLYLAFLGIVISCAQSFSQHTSHKPHNSSPNFGISPTNPILCLGENITLTATPGGTSYHWSTGATTSSITVSPGVTTTYTVSALVSTILDTAQTVVTVSNGISNIFTVAGMGSAGFGGDSGLAQNASFNYVTGVAFDPAGQNMYIADQQNDVIRKVNIATDIITTIAGTPLNAGYAGDGGPATAAQMDWPSGITYYKGNLYIADQVNGAIRKLNLATNTMSTVAGTLGTNGFSGNNGPATSANLFHPTGIAFDSSGNMYIADFGNNMVRMVNTSGTITTYAGTGVQGYAGNGLGLLPSVLGSSVQFYNPSSIAIDNSGDMFIADQGNNVVREIAPGLLGVTVNVSTLAGNTTPGYTGDGGAASAAELNQPIGVNIDLGGTVYISDEQNSVIRQVSGGKISTLAGNNSIGYSGNGGPATSAQLYYPWAVTLDPQGNIYIPDNFNNVVREIKVCHGPSVSISPSPDTICKGSSTTLTAYAAGATGYTWSTGATTQSITVTPTVNTTYSVIVSSLSGNTADSAEVVMSTVNVATSATTYTVCSGVKDTLTATGAVSYTWSPATDLSATTGSTVIADLITSSSITITYTVVGITANGCRDTTRITLHANGAPFTNIIAKPTTICKGGIVDLSDTNGVPASIYQWSPSTSLSCPSCVKTLASPSVTTTYTLNTVNSSTGCTASGTVAITVAPTATVAISASSTLICAPTGSVTINSAGSLSGGYIWMPASSLSSSTANSVVATPSATTTYSVTGSGSGCYDTAVVVITVGTIGSSTKSAPPTCPGYCNGIAVAFTSSPYPPYTYSWSSGSTTDSITSLCPGTYYVMIKNAVGCTVKDSAMVGPPPPFAVGISSAFNVSCFGSCNGSATVAASGVPPYTYSWSPGLQTSASISSLCPGHYVATVADSLGCKASDSVNIMQPPPLHDSIVPGKVVGVKCFGTNTGGASVGVKGGTPGYTYLWSDGQITSAATGLGAGFYTVTVTDKNGCTASDTITIPGPLHPMHDSISTFTNVKCFGFKDGGATDGVKGGKPPFTYAWSSGATTATVTGIGVGIYTCTVTDANGCSTVDTVSITGPSAPLLTTTDDTLVCSGQSVTLRTTASGGSPGYTYSWSTGATSSSISLTPTATSTYVVTVIDKNGCTATTTDSVAITTGLIQFPVTSSASAVCPGMPVTLTDSLRGSGTLTYNWIQLPGSVTVGNSSSIVVTPTSATTYVVTACCGCKGAKSVDSINIVTLPALSFSVCCDSTIMAGQNVKLYTNPSNYSYVWSPATGLSCTNCPDPIATPTITTTYYVTAYDTTTGCPTTDSVIITIGNGKIVIYNGFTPNGDGHNDTWVIDNINEFENSVAIFNRWDLPVWSANNYNNTTIVWSGLNSSGQPLPAATYFYIVKVEGTVYKGWVQLTR